MKYFKVGLVFEKVKKIQFCLFLWKFVDISQSGNTNIYV